MTTATLENKQTKPRNASPRVSALTQEHDGPLPVWVRAPMIGPEHYSGFSRAKLYQLAKDGSVRSVSIRKPGQTSGTRLFNLKSILDYIDRCEASAGRPVIDTAA